MPTKASLLAEDSMTHDRLRFCAALVLASSLLACRDAPPRPADSGSVATVPSLAGVDTSEPLRALGTEPFWALDIDSTGFRFTTPEDAAGTRFPPNAPSPVAGDTTLWLAKTDLSALHVRIWPEACSDGMSDRTYPYTALVRVGVTSYRGCADRRRAIVP
jgi:uncharacterized membrane protein